jgi:hypothetical protein
VTSDSQLSTTNHESVLSLDTGTTVPKGCEP